MSEGIQFHEIRAEPQVSVAPTAEPITAADMRRYLRLDDSYEDTLLDELIKSAREEIELGLRLAIMPQTHVLRLDTFPDWTIEIRRVPLQAVSSIVYVDTANASQTYAAANYVVDIYSRPARITPAYGTVWPSVYPKMQVVTITYTCGYSTSTTVDTARAAVPEQVKQAIRYRAGMMFEDRNGGMSENAERTYERLLSRIQWHGL